jgi:uncharacterized membrane protein YebE (DUF533 family)
MINAQKLLEQFLAGQAGGLLEKGLGAALGGGRGGAAGSGLGGLAGGVIASSLISMLLGSKGGRRLASRALTYGGLAALGGLALKAYRDWQASQQAPASGTSAGSSASSQPTSLEAAVRSAEGTAFLPSSADERARNELSLSILRAMISAAKADGHVDADELQRIFGHLDSASLSAEEKAFIIDELRKPLDIAEVVAGVRSREQAVEIYAASLLAIDPDQPSEKAYLDELARRLSLDPALVDHINREIAASTERA